jgi:hypothetical protein
LGGALKRSLKLAKDLPTGHRTCGLDPAQHQVNMIGQ